MFHYTSILIHNKISFTYNFTTADPEGRFIIINIIINNNPLTIGNIYGPNSDNPSFFNNFFSSIALNSNGAIIIGGDFNTVINTSNDRSNTTDTIKQFMNDIGLGDSWRVQHPSSRQYSFFSLVHQSFSRINYFLTSNSIIPNILDSQIHPITISDHAPVTLTWKQFSLPKSSSRWCFNTSLLSNPEFDKLIRNEWASFLEINYSPKSSPSLLWETGKAVLRGIIISFSTYNKRKEQEEETKLEQKMMQLENIIKINPSEDTQSELRKYKSQLNGILNNKTQFLIHRLRQEQFHHNNKSGNTWQILSNKTRKKYPSPSSRTQQGSQHSHQ